MDEHPPNGPAGTVTTTLDGVEHAFPAGLSVLDAASSVGIDIPTLCSDNRIEAAGVCRMCLVVIRGRPGDAVSCMTLLEQGMVIETSTPEITRARRMDLRMLAQNYPPGPFKAFHEKPFHRLASNYGLTEADFTGKCDPALVDNSHPYICVDMSQCIECYRCVRICEQVPGRFVWQIMDRGESTHIVPDGPTLLESSCISCGACVETCPTGALEDRSVLTSGIATNWTKTTCPYCGVGCEMNVGTREGNDIIQILPWASSPVNHGHLCVKGRYAHDYVRADDRVTEPMIQRRHSRFGEGDE